MGPFNPLFFFFLFLFFAPFSSSSPSSSSSSPSLASSCDPSQAQNASAPLLAESYSGSIIQHEYIVKWRGYYEVSGHEQMLRSILAVPPCDPQQQQQEEEEEAAAGGDECWRLVPRENPAMKFPSDFALLAIAGGSRKERPGSGCSDFEEQIKERLKGSRLVKDVVHHRRVIRSLKEVSLDEEEEGSEGANGQGTLPKRKVNFFEGNQAAPSSQLHVTSLFEADVLWKKGYKGQGVRVAVFDTGLRKDHPHFKSVKERTNWTDEKSMDDSLGHGTFVAGLVASSKECFGFAPDADVYIFRVFTNKQVSYTSWFLDAFNYAIFKRINIINLSIGGPDFMDRPFVEKVWELSANNILMVSAIGNDGPVYGTLNNPADQMDVIGVGGIDYEDKIASFSSRGMTTWELPAGYGRVKPDLVAYSTHVRGPRLYGGCRSLSGTSVASPVVAGAVVLLSSVLPEEVRWRIINPASMKQALLHPAVRLIHGNIFEQGMGKLNLLGSYNYLLNYKPTATIIPPSIDLTDCPYMWPYCLQPLYHTAMPVVLNTTILNGIDVSGFLDGDPEWIPDLDSRGDLLQIVFTYPRVIWPWTGYLALHITVVEEGHNFSGIVKGTIRVAVISRNRRVTIDLPLKAAIVPTPPRNKRVLWDQYHNLRYPSGYFPRDSLKVKNSPLDWHGDHIHTNYRDFFALLRDRDFYVEILGQPFTCFDANYYGTLVIADSEEEFFEEEIEKLQQDVRERGLSVLVTADWYHQEVMDKVKFFDENTRQWWSPQTGGANVPALNALLQDFGIQFTDKIYSGSVRFKANEDGSSYRRFTYNSGSSLGKFPEEGFVVRAPLKDEVLQELNGVSLVTRDVPIMGFLQVPQGEGRVVAFGDSSCFDGVYQKEDSCLWLIELFLDFTSQGIVDKFIADVTTPFTPLDLQPSPNRVTSSTFGQYSKVSGKTLPQCFTPRDVQMQYNHTAWVQHLEEEEDFSLLSGSRSGPFISQVGPRPGAPTASPIFGSRTNPEEGLHSLLQEMWPITYGLLLLAFIVTAGVIFTQRQKRKPMKAPPLV